MEGGSSDAATPDDVEEGATDAALEGTPEEGDSERPAEGGSLADGGLAAAAESDDGGSAGGQPPVQGSSGTESVAEQGSDEPALPGSGVSRPGGDYDAGRLSGPVAAAGSDPLAGVSGGSDDAETADLPPVGGPARSSAEVGSASEVPARGIASGAGAPGSPAVGSVSAAGMPPDSAGGGAKTTGGSAGRGRFGRRGRIALIAVGVVVVLVGGLYGVAYTVAGDKLAQNASVAGIAVGGMTPEEARVTLEQQLPELVDQPINLHLGDSDAMYDLIPSEAGLGIDVDATIEAIPGGSANPVSLVQAMLGGEDVDPVPAVDDEALRASLQAIADQANVEPVNGSLGFDGGEIVVEEPTSGMSLDIDGAVEVISAAFFGDEARELPIEELTVPVQEVEPEVTQADLEQARTEFAEPAMSGPVTVVADGESVDISAAVISGALTMTTGEDGVLQPQLDGEKLAELAEDDLAEVGQQSKDATIRMEGGSPTIVPGTSGQSIDPESLGSAVLAALTEDGDGRRAEVELAEVDPESTTETMQELGVEEVVAEFTTNYPPAQYRDTNIGRAAELVHNTLLMPGDEFSLNETVGERTAANGFTSGTIINQGRLEDAMGGGVSQVATTLYHAAFQAGLEDVEHWPHSIYFSRYPVAQEATVVWGAKDLRFRNDTPYGVLIDARVTPSAGRSQGTLTVRLWSTKHFEVETSLSERRDFTSPQTIYDTSDECSPQAGSQGFSITSFRKVWTLDGELVKDESYPWTYNPNHKVVCGPDPNDADNGDDEGEDDD